VPEEAGSGTLEILLRAGSGRLRRRRFRRIIPLDLAIGEGLLQGGNGGGADFGAFDMQKKVRLAFFQWRQIGHQSVVTSQPRQWHLLQR
jgi:hypothetical protein